MLTFRAMINTTRHTTLIMIPMLLVLLLAASLRIYHLMHQSIWFDEAFAWNIVRQPDMYPRIAADTHPPLYYLLLRGWVGVAGDSALSLRYLSAMISMMTVALTFQVGREIALRLPRSQMWRTLSLQIGALAALVLALSDAEIFLAQEARNYSLYTCTAVASMWFYLRWLRRAQRLDALGWVLATAALIYTHYQGLFIPAVQGMHVLLFLRDRQRMAGAGLLAAAGVLFLPWFLGVTLPQAQHAIDNSLPYAIPSNWDTFLHLRDNYLGAQWALMLVLGITGLGALAGVRYVTGTRQTAAADSMNAWGMTFLVFMWFLLPFCVLFFGNYFQSLLTERKLLIVAPALALMIGTGLAILPRAPRWLLVAALVIYGVSTVDFYRVKEPWNRIAAEAVPYAAPEDLAMIEAGVGQYPMLYYWEHLLPGTAITTFPFPQIRDWTLAPTTDVYTYYDALLPQLLEQNTARRVGPVATVWFLYWDKEQVNFQRLDEAGYIRTDTVTYQHLGNDIHLFRYDHLPEMQVATFENGMVLAAAEVDLDTLRVDLWWQAQTALDTDYITSVKVFDAAGALIAQKDSPPGERATSTLSTGETVYDGKLLDLIGMDTLSDDISADGGLTIMLEIYHFVGNEIITVPALDGDAQLQINP